MHIFLKLLHTITNYYYIPKKIMKLLIKPVMDRVIEDQITHQVFQGIIKINKYYSNFKMNLIRTFILNILLIMLVLLQFYFSTVANYIILFIAIVTTCMFTRTVFKLSLFSIHTFNNKTIITKKINIFIQNKKNYNFPDTVKNMIGDAFYEKYDQKMSGIKESIYSIISNLGFIKSKYEIKKDVIEIFYYLLSGYFIKILLFRIIRVTIFYGIFIFLLKGITFSCTIKMNIFEILLYPYLICIPKIFEILKLLFVK